MPIVYCKQCGKKNRAPDAAIGKKGKCAQCGAVMLIPAQDEAEPVFNMTAEEPPLPEASSEQQARPQPPLPASPPAFAASPALQPDPQPPPEGKRTRFSSMLLIPIALLGSAFILQSISLGVIGVVIIVTMVVWIMLPPQERPESAKRALNQTEALVDNALRGAAKGGKVVGRNAYLYRREIGLVLAWPFKALWWVLAAVGKATRKVYEINKARRVENERKQSARAEQEMKMRELSAQAELLEAEKRRIEQGADAKRAGTHWAAALIAGFVFMVLLKSLIDGANQPIVGPGGMPNGPRMEANPQYQSQPQPSFESEYKRLTQPKPQREGPQWKETTCRNCGGSGTGNFACFSCGGTGFSSLGARSKCSYCNGKGFDRCSSCNGTGRTRTLGY